MDDLVKIEQGLRNQGEFRRQAKTRLAADARDFQDDAPRINLLHVAALMLRDEVCDLAAELLLLKALLRLAQFDGQRGGFVAAPLADGKKQLQKFLLRLRRDAPDHAQVNQGDAVVVCQKDVAGMRVCVEDAINEDLLEIGMEKIFGQLVAVQIHQRQRTQSRDLLAFDVIHRQHARGAVVFHRHRHDDSFKLTKVSIEDDEVARFLPVVEFTQKAFTQFPKNHTELITTARLRMIVQKLRDALQDFQILEDDFAYSGSLHFDDHLTTISHLGAMRLTERSGSDGLRLETGEGFGEPHAEFFGHDLFHLFEGERLDIVLQAREGFQIWNGQKVCARRKKLRQLDEGRPHLFEVF